MSIENFYKSVETEVVCKRIITKSGRERRRKIENWVREVLNRPEVLGITACHVPSFYGDEELFFTIYIKRGQKPIKTDDELELAEFYWGGNDKIKTKLPLALITVVEVDELPEFSEKFIREYCCGYSENFAVWVKTDKKKQY